MFGGASSRRRLGGARHTVAGRVAVDARSADAIDDAARNVAATIDRLALDRRFRARHDFAPRSAAAPGVFGHSHCGRARHRTGWTLDAIAPVACRASALDVRRWRHSVAPRTFAIDNSAATVRGGAMRRNAAFNRAGG